MPKIDVNKKIKHIEDIHLGEKTKMDDFIAACQKEWATSSFKQKPIVIKKPDHLLVTKVDPALLLCGDVSSGIRAKDAARIFKKIVEITTDPIVVADLLKDLDDDLGKAMQKNNIQFTDKDYPEFLITGKGNYIPGPPPR